MEKLSEVDKGYIAGIIDGEGTITIVKSRDSKYREGFNFRPLVQISNRNLAMLEWIQDTIKMGYIFDNELDGRTYYALRLYVPDVVQLLPEIVSALKIKQRNAELVMEYIHISKTCKRTGRGGRIPQDAWVKMHSLYEEIGKNNQHQERRMPLPPKIVEAITAMKAKEATA